MPKVSFIVVNWDGKELLPACLDAILGQSYRDFEVVFVDNGSKDGSADFVRQKYPETIVVELDGNYGFTGGNNQGLLRCSGEYVALVNNDAILAEDWLHHTVSVLETRNDVGLCSTKIIIDGTDKIDSVGDLFTSAFTGCKVGELMEEVDFDQTAVLHGACAAAAIYRKTMLDDIGFFDDDFFLNHEDTDLNMRAWLAGWICVFVPQSVVWHKVNASIGTMSDVSVYHFVRNNVWLWFKNVPGWFMLTNCGQRFLYEIAAFYFFCCLNQKWQAYFKGKIDAFMGLPAILRKRALVQKNVRLSRREIRAGLISVAGYLIMRSRRAQ